MTDPRLICEGCGERGEVLDDPYGGYYVAGTRDSGVIDLATGPQPTGTLLPLLLLLYRGTRHPGLGSTLGGCR